MRKINPEKISRAQELKMDPNMTQRKLQDILKEEFGSGITWKYITDTQTKLTPKGQQLLKAMYGFFIKNQEFIENIEESDILMFSNVEEILDA